MLKQEKSFQDPAIPRKKALLERTVALSGKVLLPSMVEISESGICNRSCVFCPKSDPDYPNEPIFIKKKLVNKLTRELAEYNYEGILVFSGFCEPLLDRNIFNLIENSRSNLPNAKIELVTNGDVLNEVRMKRLFSSGLSTLLISAYDGEFQLKQFLEMADNAGVPQSRVVIRPRYLPPENQFGITLNNRAGTMSNAEHKLPAVKEPIKEGCNYPYYAFFMDYTGEVLLCPHDWSKRLIVGNVTEQRFDEIWTSEVIESIRERLNLKDRNYAPCNLCDVQGLLMGSTHYKKWLELRN